jgi:exosortase
MFGWSMILWLGACVWLVWGRRMFVWALPALGFLFFMVPLPFRAEQWLSHPLQRSATKVSTWVLQICGEPAIAQGNTIFVGSDQLEVEDACSGLRMLVGVAALAIAYGVLARRPWQEKLLLLLSIVPISVLANSIRIVLTGFAVRYLPSEASRDFAHDLAGWLVIPLAAFLMWIMLAYWHRLFIPLERAEGRDLIQRETAQAAV